MGRGSFNLLYSPISNDFAQYKKGEQEWTLDLNHLDVESCDKVQWLEEITKLIDTAINDPLLVKPLVNLINCRLREYIRFNDIQTQKFKQEINQLFSFMYNNRDLIEDQEKYQKLARSLINSRLRFKGHFFYNSVLIGNIPKIFNKLEVDIGNLYIMPTTNRGRYRHYLRTHRHRLCDNGIWSPANWVEKNEADDRSTNYPLCAICHIKSKNMKLHGNLQTGRIQYSNFESKLLKSALSEALKSKSEEPVVNYLLFQEQFVSDFIIQKINQEASRKLNWSTEQERFLEEQLSNINSREITQEQLDCIPQVKIF